jgi:cytosine/adenosine deaminase-related metal-dependent hydrolase
VKQPLLLRPALALCPSGTVTIRPWILIGGGRIQEIGHGPPPPVSAQTEIIDHPELVLLPGFVNPHTHLVLTAMAGRLEPTRDFWGWLFDLVAMARAQTPEENARSVDDGLMLSAAAGTTTLLDFARPETPAFPQGSAPRALRAAEVIARAPGDAHGLLTALGGNSPAMVAPHAVYSTTAETVQALGALVREQGGLLTIHLSETEDENRLWQTGQSEGLRRYYHHFGSDRSWWQCPRCSPTRYLADLGALGPNSLLVHCNYLSEEDVELIAASGSAVCLCPATHRFFGHAPHPLPRLLRAGVPVCLGTDSLASSPSLSMWDQVRIVAEDHPALEWTQLLAMITTAGARALGLAVDHGTLRPGAPADLALAWPRAELDAIAESPRRLFEEDIAIQWVLIEGQRVLAATE